MTLELRLEALGFSCWLDQNAAEITKGAMQEGVAASKVFLLFLSRGVLSRPFCVFEIETAMSLQKKMMLMHETDARHGAFDFAEAASAPPQMASLVETHESLPWRRRRFEQDGILRELIKASGLVARAAPAPAGRLGPRPETGRATEAPSGLAPVPETVPVLPESFTPRPADQAQILDVLLGRNAATRTKCMVSAHGMGGLGKTTLAASVARAADIRAHFDRIGFVSAGQAPEALELQRQLYTQLVGAPLEIDANSSVAKQRDLLAQAAAESKWLAVLDDIWDLDTERALNFVAIVAGEHARCKVLVTTRFARMLPGYVEVALGLFEPAEAVELLRESAELGAGGTGHNDVLLAISKCCGYLPLFLQLDA